MKRIKKTIAIVLSVLMVLLMLPLSVFAANPTVESILIEFPRALIEKFDGNNGYYYDFETLTEHEFFVYSYDIAQITINYKDGTTLSGNVFEIFDATGEMVFYTDDQDYFNQWGVGTHKATAEFMGVETNFEVEIVASPVESISVTSPVQVIENYHGGYTYYYNEETGEYDLSYFHYGYPDTQVTITYKDGTTLSGDYWEIYEATGQWVEYSDDQSYDNQWGVGAHKATAKFYGVETDFKIEVIETPVESISVEVPRALKEGVDGYIGYGYNEETDDFDLEYFKYEYDFAIMTVKFKDGTNLTGTTEEIFSSF